MLDVGNKECKANDSNNNLRTKKNINIYLKSIKQCECTKCFMCACVCAFSEQNQIKKKKKVEEKKAEKPMK